MKLLALALVLPASVAAAQDVETFRADFLADRLDWSVVEARAQEEGQVAWFHWGGDSDLNVWIDTVVAPALAERGIELQTVRIPSTRDAVDLIVADDLAGRGLGQGSVDVVWVNGDNFLSLASQDLLFGSFAERLPASRYYVFDPADPRGALNLTDFGVPTEGTEMPWSAEQFVCFHDRARLPDPPGSFDELAAWLQEHPGRFTYVRPPNFDGNSFVQSVLYAFNPDGTGAAPFQRSAEELGAAELTRLIEPGFAYLDRIEPLLHEVHPENAAALDLLFVNGEIDLGCRFGLFATAVNVANGSFPTTAQNLPFPGLVANKSYLAIPANAPHPAAALVLIDLLSTPQMQASKLEAVGYPPALDLELPAAAPQLAGVTLEELAAAVAPDTHATLVRIIERVWIEHVERGSPTAIADLVAGAFATR